MIIGLDTETTGLNPELDRIIELSMGAYEDDGKFIKNLTLRFNPERPIDPRAQAVHGISIEELYDKPKFGECADEILAMLNSAKLVVIHNAAFDVPFVSNELLRCGRQLPTTFVYDTLQSRWATPTGKVPKLSELCWSLDVDYQPQLAHSADYDVSVMMQCFFTMAQCPDLLTCRPKPFNSIKGKSK